MSSLLLNMILLVSNLFLHPVHLSVTNIDYSIENKKIAISVRLFKDDFELILNTINNIAINIGKENEDKKADIYIKNYITQNLKLNINEKNISEKKFILKEKKTEDITLWLFFEIKFSGNISKIEIINTLMLDLYKDQKNLVIFSNNENENAMEFSVKEISNIINY